MTFCIAVISYEKENVRGQWQKKLWDFEGVISAYLRF